MSNLWVGLKELMEVALLTTSIGQNDTRVLAVNIRMSIHHHHCRRRHHVTIVSYMNDPHD